MDKEIYNTLYLYIDEDGNKGEDLREVQLMEGFSQERINKLIELTNNEDSYISYQANIKVQNIFQNLKRGNKGKNYSL